MQSEPGRSALHALLARPGGGGDVPVARSLWRAHVVLARGVRCRVVASVVGARAVAADPFVLVRSQGEDRLEVDLWVEGDDARTAVDVALQAWRDLARLSGLPRPRGVGEQGADTFEVVAIDVARTDGLRPVRG